MTHWTKDNAEKKIAAMGMDDMPLAQVVPTPAPVAPDWFAQYRKLCKKFMESLSDSADTLAFMNLTQDEFVGLLMGRALPENTSIRFRVPLQWGGKLEIENMFLCRTFPHGYNMDRFILAQSGNDIIWMPDPVKKIYCPTHNGFGGDGGNATEDRMTQIATQMSASYDM